MDRTVGGRFKIVRPVGSGGMATVFEAIDLRLNRRVALKLIDAVRADERMRLRFAQEATTLAGLSHANLVEVYDTGEEDGTLYIVMELIEGPDLAAVLIDGPLTVERALHICDDVLAALIAVHEHGLVHRDVKPANVLLASRATKLADFGIAKSVTDAADLTDTGQLLGTARYLAPERLSGQPASPASDLYSVGVMLFEMLVGRTPFNGESPAVIAFAHHNEPVPVLADHLPGIDSQLSSIVSRALAKRPEDRFESAAAMRAALTSVPRGAASTAPTPPAVHTKTPISAAATEPARSGHIIPLVLAVVAIAVLVGLLLWFGDRNPIERANTPDTREASASTQSNTTTTSSRSTATSASTVGSVATPADVDALVDHLRERPGAYGVKHPDLLDKLNYVQQQSGAKRVEEAEKLIVEASKWAAEGELDRVITAVTVEVLRDDAGG